MTTPDTTQLPTGAEAASAGVTADPGERAAHSPLSLALRRFRGNIGAMISLAVLALIVAVVVIGPFFLPDPSAQTLTEARRPPSGAHLLGTDALGRDMLARLLQGGRISLLVGIATALSSLVLGTVIGVVSGRMGGWVDNLLMRITDVFMSIPGMLVVIVVAGIVGPSLPLLIFLIAAFSWPSSARIARAVVLSVRELDFVKAAEAAGTREHTIMLRHLLPAVIPQVTVAGTLLVASAMLQEASLSFLGLGVIPPTASWGNLLQSAQSFTVLSSQPWLWLPPGAAIIITSVCVIFVGDGLRDALDPKASR